jgi:dimethylaniline monooxygenase (N-oxide forming)
VCVIGAGASGLTTIRQLQDVNITNVDCFEKDDDVGGLFNYGPTKTGVYDNAVLTISNYLMAFSDMPPTGHRYHWHHTEYKQYLQQYAKKYDLFKHIAFHTKVLSVQGEPGKWHVVVQDQNGKVIDKGFYDAVAVCSGAHQALNEIIFPGMDNFGGQVSHSSTYKNNKPFEGKDCVVVGLGESGADIVREVSQVANSTVLALRSYPYLIPRLARPFHSNPLGCPSDAFTSHLRHDLLLVPKCRYQRVRDFLNRLMCTLAAILFFLLPFLGTGGYSSKQDAFKQDRTAGYLDKDTANSPLVAALIYSWCNRSGQQECGQKFACKNVMFTENVVNGRIKPNASSILRLDKDAVVFKDGFRAKCDCLVMCTGYKDVFPFFKGNIGNTLTPLEVPDGNVRRLYKHVFHPQIGKSMAWIGFVRPSTGGIPACAEMAARYFALVLSGQRELPENITDLTAAEYEFDTRYFSLSPDVRTLVGYKDWMDSIAALIGCEVSLWKYVFRPKLFVRLCIGSLLPSQYRLDGPGRLTNTAMNTILELPVAATPAQSLDETRRAWLRHLGIRRLWQSDM